LNIIILTKESFPVGLAATNRIHCYAKGFIELSSEVMVLCIKPTERKPKVVNKVEDGIYENIPFAYPGKETVYSSWFIKRRIQNIAGLIGTIRMILKLNHVRRIDALIIYLNAPFIEFLIFLLARFSKIILLKEENEHPYIYFPTKRFFYKCLRRYYIKYNYCLYDGLLLMTNHLIKLFGNNEKIKSRILHVPMTVDYERFEKKINTSSTESYIAYCGILNDKKDGINLLIEAFSRISDEFEDLKLHLIGQGESELKMKEYLKLTYDKQITEKVVFKGKVSRVEIPELLCKAKLLVLPRPQNMQAEYGFPTKLGEYLATGVPVVTTKVGEIPFYLNDGESAFLAEPGSTDSLMFKMKEALLDYAHAIEVGKKGKTVALNYFNYQIQAARIIDFIKKIRSCAG
jgi:glycosyltransferase involved in cell wall biosynthesis